MNFFSRIYAVFFKKCCFCKKNFKWEDKIVPNIYDKRLSHYICYIEKIRTTLNYFNKKEEDKKIDVDDFDDSEFYG